MNTDFLIKHLIWGDNQINIFKKKHIYLNNKKSSKEQVLKMF